MSDNPGTTPEQQGTPPAQQVQNPAPEQTPPGENWKARFDGAVLKLQQLTQANRDLETQLATKSSEIEQLKAQLGIKDTEKTVAVSERDKQLQQALTRVAELERENAELQGLKLKVKVAKDLNRPELMKIVDRIPNLTDEEALKTVMTDFASFADDLVKEREKQLLAGITPGAGPGGPQVTTPATSQAWMEKINSMTLGSPERTKALNDYGDWLEKQHQAG